MSELKKIYLDATNLEHPEPLERSVASLQELDDNSYFYMYHRKKPVPLLQLALKQGLKTYELEDSSGYFHILIAKKSNINLEELVSV